jgi:hypothetical protein
MGYDIFGNKISSRRSFGDGAEMICSIYRKFLLCNKSNSNGAASGYKDSWGTGSMRGLSPHGGLLRITKIVQVSAMKVHFQIAERSLFYLNPYIHLRRMTYPPERGTTH